MRKTYLYDNVFLSLFLLSVCHCIRKVHICYFLANKNLLFLNILQIINYKKKL